MRVLGKEHCPFHPALEPRFKGVKLSGGNYVKIFCCSDKDCYHEWTVDVTEKMAEDYL